MHGLFTKHRWKRSARRRFVSALAAAVWVGIGASFDVAIAQNGTASQPDLIAALSTAEARTRDQSLDATVRANAAREADELRSRLLETRADDDRAATWLVDRAAYALERAGANGADLVCLYGVPTRQQAEYVRPFAQSAIELADQAEKRASKSIETLEARLIDRSKVLDAAAIADIEARLKTLVETEQARRIPMVRGLARTLHASVLSDAQAATIAAEAVRDLERVPAGVAAAARLVALATANQQQARAGGGTAQEKTDIAIVQFESAAQAAAQDDPGLSLRIRLGLARAGWSAKNAPAAATPNALEREARARYWLDLSTRDIASRTRHASEAIRELFAAAPTPEQIAAGATDTRVETCEKIASILPKSIPLTSLPPEAAFARGVTLARASGAARRELEEAAANLAYVADRADAAPDLRCAARWERAVIMSGFAGDGSGAADELAAFDALARVFTEDRMCASALEAARRAAAEYARRRAPGARMSDAWRDRAGVYRIALALLLEREPEDRWRIEAVRLACDDLAGKKLIGAGEPIPTIDRADTLIAQIATSETKAALRGALADAITLRIDQHRTAAVAAKDPIAAWRAEAPFARRALVWAKTNDPAREPSYALALGEALAYSDDRAALDVLSPLLGGPIDAAASPLFTRYRFALSRAHRLRGDETRAFTVLREAAGALEGEPGAKTREPAFWSAWAEMLKILQAMNADGSRSGDIRVQIKRLELLDPALGGAPYAEQIRQVRAAVGE